MALLTDADWDAMAADRALVRADNPVSVVLRRGDATLGAQTVRIAGKGYAGSRNSSGNTAEARGTVVISGAVDFDVQIDDRFTHAGKLYRVIYIRPNTRAGVTAEAMLEE